MKSRGVLLTVVLTVGLVLGSGVPALADGQLWLLASVTKTIGEVWRLNAEVAPRWEQDVSDYSRTVLRTQVARRVGERVWLGAGYEHHSPDALYVRRENRVWQQVQILHPAGGWTLSHRARIEERWLEFAQEMSMRARYQFRASHPITRGSRWSWLVLDEVLVTTRGARLGPPQGFDRHRIGGGVGRTLNDHVSIEGGVTWQYINRPPPLRNQNDHWIVLSLLARY